MGEKMKLFLSDAVRRVDPILLICTTFLSLVSLVTVYGAVDNFGMSKLRMQFAMTVAGVVLTFVVANLDYHVILDRLWAVMLIFSVGILGLTLVAGDTGAGVETANKSWLTIPGIGIAIQPSEFVKITFTCTFAKHLSSVRATINQVRSIVGLGLHALLIVGLILVSGDLGVALVYIALTAIMLFGAGLSLWYFAGAIGAAVLAAPYLWSVLATHQQERIIYGFRPDLDPLGAGMHAMTSKAAIASGGLFGRGMSGAVAYQSMPTKGTYTDFIFAIFGEMFGFFACFLLILIYAVMIIRTLHIARRHRKDMGSFICIGVAGVLLAQVLENIGMCLAMLPVVGITLPFMSYGGSSMLTNYALLALVHSVHANRNKYYFEREPS